MPKCYLNAIRGYRTGKYKGNSDHDPHVMTTRSGLSIRKVHARTPKGFRTTIRSSTPVPRQRKENTSVKKYPVIRYKSLSYLSFVTRFIIALRVPELELAGVDPKETLEYLGDNGHFYRSGSTSSSHNSYDDEHASETESEEEDVFEGVDDDGVFCSDNETGDSQEDNEELSESISEISLNENQNSGTLHTNMVVHSSVNLEAKFLGVNLSKKTQQNENYIKTSVNSIVLQLKNETQIPFKCEECGKGFTLFSAYTAHVRSHSTQRNRCGVCGKIFTRSWLLKGHMRTHTGERPFPCAVEGCDRAFADKSNLRSHMLIHSVTSKNFTCEKCGRAFAQKRYLHKHMLEVCRLI